MPFRLRKPTLASGGRGATHFGPCPHGFDGCRGHHLRRKRAGCEVAKDRVRPLPRAGDRQQRLPAPAEASNGDQRDAFNSPVPRLPLVAGEALCAPTSTLECEKMKVAATASLLLIATMTAWPDVAFSQDRQDITSDIHQKITKNFTNYIEERRSKALAGCINWESSTPDNINVRHLLFYYTAEGSGRSFLASQLMRPALNACNERRKKDESNCKCVPISKNGRSALKVPDAFIEKARAQLTPPKPLERAIRAEFALTLQKIREEVFGWIQAAMRKRGYGDYNKAGRHKAVAICLDWRGSSAIILWKRYGAGHGER